MTVRRPALVERAAAFARSHRGLLGVLALEVPFLAGFFSFFPDSWDAAEYSWCLKGGYLPHSPYLLFLLSAHAFHLVLSPPVALSALSVLGGLASTALFFGVQRRLGASEEAATLSTLFLGLSYHFILESTHQEVYALETAWLLLSLFLLTGRAPRPLAGGVVFGLAVAVHSSSLFVLPGLVWAAATARQPDGGRTWTKRSWVIWGLGAVTVVFVFAILVFAFLPVAPGGSRVAESSDYLRGIGPGLSAGRWSADFLARSAAGLLERVFGLDLPLEPLVPTRRPLGLRPWHLAVLGFGVLISCRPAYRRMRTWLLWPAAYAAYEVLLGASPDAGIYMPLFLPPVCAYLGLAVAGLPARGSPKLARALRAAAAILVLAPGLGLLVADWNRTREGARRHFSSQVLAAVWMEDHLPRDAFVVSTLSRNHNLMPYYSARRPILADQALLFRDLGRFTPLNRRSFEPLTTASLAAAIEEGRWVVALEPDPFRGVRGERLDPRRFAWREIERIDLRSVVDRIPRSVRPRIPLGHVGLYRAYLRP